MQKYGKILIYKWDIGTFFLLVTAVCCPCERDDYSVNTYLLGICYVSGSVLAAGGTGRARVLLSQSPEQWPQTSVFAHLCRKKN